MEITVKGRVTNLTGSMWVNKDDSGQEVAGKKNIQVNLENGYSFRTFEGDDLFADVSDYVRIGMEVEVKCSSINPAPYDSTQTSSSGEEIITKRYYMNLQDPELINISEPVRNEKFAALKKQDPIQFAHKEGSRSFGRKGSKPSGPVKHDEPEDDDIPY